MVSEVRSDIHSRTSAKGIVRADTSKTQKGEKNEG